jgi:hypothetical protein
MHILDVVQNTIRSEGRIVPIICQFENLRGTIGEWLVCILESFPSGKDGSGSV